MTEESDIDEETVTQSNASELMSTDDDYQKQIWIRNLTQTEGCFESPIDISITHSKIIQLPPLEWTHFEVSPKKINAKWGQERPYICNGPFLGKYVFSNWHLHWGANNMEGSEHTVDGAKYPAEMHVVLFKSSYLTQEAALKEQDGCATMVYLFKLQDAPNPAFQVIVDALLDISEAGTSKKLSPTAITDLVRMFTVDYFMYWGSLSTEKCTHYIMWIISRIPIGVSSEQIDALRFIADQKGENVTRNFREVQSLNDRSVLHVCPSSSKYATLLNIPENKVNISQVYRCEVFLNNKALRTKDEVVLQYAIELKKFNSRKYTDKFKRKTETNM